MNLFDFALYYYSKERHANLLKGQRNRSLYPLILRLLSLKILQDR